MELHEAAESVRDSVRERINVQHTSSSHIDSNAYRIQGVQSVNQRVRIQQSDSEKAKVMFTDGAVRTRGKAGQGNAMQDI